MKKFLAVLLALTLSFSLVACGGAKNDNKAEGEQAPADNAAKGELPVVGAIWYNFGDTFIANARTTLNDAAANGGKIKVNEADSQNDIATQTNNINNFYSQGVDYLVLNNININAKGEIIEQAKSNSTPIIFANTDSPSEEEFAMYEDVYHVSSRAEQSGTIIGEALAKYWKEHPEADRNGDGKLNYVMLLGVQQHYDTQVRAELSVKALKDNGIEVEMVQEAICNYQRNEAQNQMASILQSRKDDIEAVIACNDDMALGAIEALKATGFFKDEETYIPVVGVDATKLGVEAVQEGTLLATALNNPVTLGNSIYELLTLLADGKELTQENIDIAGATVDGHHIYIDYVGITADNTEDAAY